MTYNATISAANVAVTIAAAYLFWGETSHLTLHAPTFVLYVAACFMAVGAIVSVRTLALDALAWWRR